MIRKRRIKIHFSYDHIGFIEMVAKGWVEEAKKNGFKPKYGQGLGNIVEDHRVACRAEAAVNQHFGVEYKPGKYRGPDSLDFGGAEIRGTQYNQGQLLGHDGEEKKKMDVIFILVNTPLNKNFVWLAGWCYGYEFLKAQYYTDHFGHGRPCYAFRQGGLKDIRDLFYKNGIIYERISGALQTQLFFFNN